MADVDTFESIGKIAGAGRVADLVLMPARPLSFAKVRQAGMSSSLARFLLDHRTAPLNLRIPVALGDADEVVARLDAAGVPAVFPLLGGCLALLAEEQVQVLGGLLTVADAVTVGRLRFPGPFRLDSSGDCVDRWKQYWASGWTFVDEPAESYWRVWPQGERHGIRGDFIANVNQEVYDQLGGAPFVVVENPFLPDNFLAAVLRSESGPGTRLSGRTVAIDASLRMALGIYAGEFCRLYPWKQRSGLRRARRIGLGSRTLVAHTKAPARTDLEKEVCRLDADALESIGARPDETVIVETLVWDGFDWSVRKIRRRALTISPDEARERAKWERPSGRSGYVDPAELHNVYPPFPPLYLDYHGHFALGRGDRELPIGAAVTVRASFVERVLFDAAELLWVAVAGVILVVLTRTDVPVWVAIGLPLALGLALIVLRVRRALR